MKRNTLYIIITVSLCIVAYIAGTKYTESATLSKDVPLNQCIPLEDVAGYYINDSGFLCVELKDIRYQMDDINNDAYIDILEGLEDITMDYSDRYLDMNAVAGYSGTDGGQMIYSNDGYGYYLEVRKTD